NNNPFVNEQITLTLKFYIAVKFYGSPELSEPTTTGFWTELIGNKTPYNQFINNRQYKIIERTYALFPTHTGALEIGRAMIRVTVASKKKSRRSNNFFGGLFGSGEEVSVRSKLIKINVKPLPTKGKPKDFTGAIGKFSISSTVNKKIVDVNQPVSVTIRLSGRGNIKSLAEPTIPKLENQFRIYRASTSENISKTTSKIGGTKIFEEVFIPKRPGDVEIPKINYNYFDPETQRYKYIATKSIMLKVTKPEGYTASGDIPFNAPDIKLSSDARDIRYIKDNIGDTQQTGQILLLSPTYILVNTIPLILFAGMMIVRIRKEKFEGDIGLARSKTALREAKKKLTKAKSIAHTDTTSEFYVEVYSAVTTFIADKLGKHVPWHLSAFHPDYKMQDHEYTGIKTLQRARDIGKKAGLHYVYMGNVAVHGDTYCPDCGELLIDRTGYSITVDKLVNGHCPKCSRKIEGVWS
ncbi:MAG: BatD family protein, partial [Campylobacteraceae bacterium]|nr:BatD family protein [Campylobacteraceae bacterium]